MFQTIFQSSLQILRSASGPPEFAAKSVTYICSAPQTTTSARSNHSTTTSTQSREHEHWFADWMADVGAFDSQISADYPCEMVDANSNQPASAHINATRPNVCLNVVESVLYEFTWSELGLHDVRVTVKLADYQASIGHCNIVVLSQVTTYSYSSHGCALNAVCWKYFS